MRRKSWAEAHWPTANGQWWRIYGCYSFTWTGTITPTRNIELLKNLTDFESVRVKSQASRLSGQVRRPNAGRMASSRQYYNVRFHAPCVAAILLASMLIFLTCSVGAFVPAVSSGVIGCSNHFCSQYSGTSSSTSIMSKWNRHNAPLARVIRRRDTQQASTPEDAETSGGDGALVGNSEGEESANIWARAELPLSNDQQVQQATRAVWKVYFILIV